MNNFGCKDFNFRITIKTNKTLHKQYYDALTKWIQASQEKELADEDLQKYQSNITAGLPEVMVFLKDFQQEMFTAAIPEMMVFLNDFKKVMVSKVDKLESQNKELKNENKPLKNEIASIKSDVASLRAGLKGGLKGVGICSQQTYHAWTFPNL